MAARLRPRPTPDWLGRRISPAPRWNEWVGAAGGSGGPGGQTPGDRGAAAAAAAGRRRRRAAAGGGSRREGARAKRGGGGARAQPTPRARRRADNKQPRAGRCPRRCSRPRAVLPRPPGLSPPARRYSPRAPAARPRGPTDLGGEMELFYDTVLVAETTSQQERLQAIAEKRRRQAEIENRRRQLEDDRRQLQHLKSKALRERWLLAGTPSSASEGDEDMRRQMQEDEQKARLLEESISRLEQEIEELENADALPAAAKESPAAPSPARTPAPAPAPRPAQEDQRAEAVLNSQQAPVGTPKEKRISNTPLRTVEGSTMMKAVVHAVDGTAENGIHPLSSSEVDELIHKADEVTLSEAGSAAGSAEPRGPSEEAVRTTPSRREITGVQAQPGEATSGPPGIQPGQEPPVTMIFMGYQNVEDEAETQKVLGLQDTITAELVVIEDAAEPKEPAPPNGSAAEPPATEGSREENQVGLEAPASDPQDLDMKKQRCKCCSIM
ncbi:paralemmin-1 isoform X3 [Sagmatias obliquidens]|uniref:paralemmin-1 isoform X3 n=1 Tax=Sagmatias obliquidens TaxID=3371155 RepID=UPI000F4447C4|nr:paralemmin-1 isoform X3 [Lagenorhynchus obliquidens]